MNSDVLLIILSYLKCKQMIGLERVSKQFGQCVRYLMCRYTSVEIGSEITYLFIDYMPKHEFISKPINICPKSSTERNEEFVDLIQNKEIIAKSAKHSEELNICLFATFKQI